MVYEIAHASARLLIAAVARVRAEEVARLDRAEPYVLVSNHLTLWDVPLVFSRTPRHTRMVVLAADKWRRVLPIRWLFDAVGCVWVRRGEPDRAALNEALAFLRAGRVVGIAPEGTRSSTGALQRGRSGAAWLARASGVPVMPVAIWGVEKLPWAEVHLRVGPALAIPAELSLEEATDLIMRSVAALLPEQYRGVFR